MPIRMGKDDAKRLGIKTPKRKYNKFHNVRTVYNGVKYASKAEAARAATLDQLVQAGVVHFWIGQPKFRLGCPENVYIADMLVRMRDGSVHVEDVKGKETSKFRRDKILWRSYGPCRLHIIRDGRVVEVIEPGRR